MLAKSNRLTTKQVNETIKEGINANSFFFRMRYRLGNKEKKFSAIVPQKIFKTAVSRSKNKRIIYDLVQGIEGKIISGIWALVFAKQELTDIPKEKLVADMNSLFIKAKLMYS